MNNICISLFIADSLPDQFERRVYAKTLREIDANYPFGATMPTPRRFAPTGGSLPPEWVAGFAWIRWQLSHRNRWQISAESAPVHPSNAWYLADLGELRGMQTLYTTQSPQRLEALRAHALIGSAVSFNRIEGVSVAPERLRELWAAARPLFRDRDEEVRGYRGALTWIHEEAERIPPDEATVTHLHDLARGEIRDAGQ